MSNIVKESSNTVKEVALFFSLLLLAAVPCAAIWTGEQHEVLSGWIRILTSPCPLVTDYYQLGNLPGSFLNAAACGLACTLLMICTKATCRSSTWAGYFLVIAHCFYGLNFINMWPPMIGIFIFCKVLHIDFRDNLDVAMFSTAFGPFFSEILFRYPYGKVLMMDFGKIHISLGAVLLVAALTIFLGFAIPAMLPGALKLHKGYNLYNGGLAFGLLGLFVYAAMFKTVGLEPAAKVVLENAVYEAHGNSYGAFCNAFYLIAFGSCVVIGFCKNHFSLRGYGELLSDSGYQVAFLQKYGSARTWINLGIYGLFMLLYFNVVIRFTEGAGFTGATCGVILAAMTFASSGQHPRNVWPILGGFAVLSVVVHLLFLVGKVGIPWTLSTQGYMNGIAFATGLCPFTGRYGRKIGMLAGIICAIMCTTTSVMHGGFVLYNGGLTAGITAIILTPFLEFYAHGLLKS